MKKIIKLTVVILGVVLLNSCEDFLTKEPQGNIDVEEYYKYANDLQLGLNAAYEVMSRESYQMSEWLFGDATSDDIIRSDDLSPSSPIGKVMNFTFSTDDPLILERWKVNYIGINKTNWVISEGPEAYAIFKEFDIDSNYIVQEARSFRRIIGQAKFLRALYYFNLVKTFGGVPIMPEKLVLDENGNNFNQPRSTKEEVYQYIEKDLREAILVLEADYSFVTNPEEKGRITKGAAVAMLIKVLAYQAENGVPGGHLKWKQALQFAGHMVDATPGSINLSDILDYKNLYNNENLLQIFESLSIDINDLNFKTSGLTEEEVVNTALNTNYDQLLPGEKSVINKYELIDYQNLWLTDYEYNSESILEINLIDNQQYTTHGNFLISNGVIEVAQAGPQLDDERFKDPRLAISFVTKGERVSDIQTVNPLIQPMQTYVTKWFSLNEEEPTYGQNSKNMSVMRFAEVILFYAEALNETGDAAQAMDQIQVLRDRANRLLDVSYINGAPKELTPLEVGTYTTTRDIIWEERRMELCFEFDRFWDMVRQGKATTLMAEYNKLVLEYGSEYQKNYKALVNEIFPIPQEEINLSNGVLAQNPGY